MIENINIFEVLSRILQIPKPGGRFYLSNGEDSHELCTIQDIATKVVEDEWTLFTHWRMIVDLTTPAELYKKPKKVDIIIYVNGTKIPYRRSLIPKPKHIQNCGICYEDFTPDSEIRQFPCGHMFHNTCATSWLFREQEYEEDVYEMLASSINRFTCPYCRLNMFDHFFFNYYKPCFIKQCDKEISPENKARIEHSWSEQTAS